MGDVNYVLFVRIVALGATLLIAISSDHCAIKVYSDII